jgi:hypothetical protein
MFPQGGPGIGLLLLRIAATGMFVLNVVHRFNLLSSPLSWPILVLVGLVALGLLLGFLTPLLSIVICVAAVLNLFTDQQLNPVYVVRILTSASLLFLGPGAYSVDARLFGLQVTVVAPRKNKNQRQSTDYTD